MILNNPFKYENWPSHSYNTFILFFYLVSTLYELCAHSIVNRTTVYGIDRLKLPSSVKQNLKSYAVTNYSISQTNKKFLRRPGSSSQYYTSGSFKNKQSGGSPAPSICNSLRRVHRTRQHTPLANTP